MKETFDLGRFASLFKKHTVENYKAYLLSLGVLTGGLTLVMTIISYINNGHISVVQQGIVFLFMMFLSGTVFTSIIFSDLGDRKRAIPMLTLPASHLEKALVAWIYAFVIFQIIYLGCFYLVDSVTINFINRNQVDKSLIVNVFSREDHFWIAFPQFAVLNSICFIGAVWFEKLHFIKTAFTFLIFVLLLTLFNYLTLGWMFAVEIAKAPPFNSVGIIVGDKFWRIKGNTQSDIVLLLTVVLVCILLWAGSYFKLKEKQV